MPRRPAKRRKAPRTQQQRYQRIAISFLGVVIVVGIAAALLSIGRVKVVVTASPVPVVVDFDVTVTPTIRDERSMVGRVLHVDGTASLERSVVDGGEVIERLPPKRAEGTVTLVNDRSEAQTLVATTRLLSPDGILFRLRHQEVIPASGKLEAVDVYADQIGDQGNIQPTKFSIPGLSSWMQQHVWAESSAVMAGGRGSPDDAAPGTAIVTQEAIDALKVSVIAIAEQDARNRANASAERGEEVRVIGILTDAKTDAVAGQSRASISVDAVATAQVLLTSRGALLERVRTMLEEAAGVQGRVLRGVNEAALRMRVVAEDPRVPQATLSVHAEGEARIAPSFASLDARRIIGFSSEDVQTYLQSIPGVESVDVQLWPFWVTTVPANGRVEVEVQETE
ncbi:MAG: hypothetical protein ABIG71_02465 [Candidatus Uhrbacteria bacterium]